VQRALVTAGGIPGQPEEPPQEAGHVHIDERLGAAVHDRQDGARRVGADARQTLQGGSRIGERPGALLEGQREVPQSPRLLPPESERLERGLEVLGG
jgi:hypothetical protein